MPVITVNYLGVALCVIVAMPLGFLWFGPLFGKSWARHMGLQDVQQPGGVVMAKSLANYALGSPADGIRPRT